MLFKDEVKVIEQSGGKAKTNSVPELVTTEKERKHIEMIRKKIDLDEIK